MHLDFVDLRLVAHIADTGNLAGAAERCAISPSAASVRIKDLEEQLGVQLLYRASRGVSFTPAGESLLHHARVVLDEMEHMACDMQDYGGGIKGHVRIWANTTAISDFLPSVLSTFLCDYPDVNIDLKEMLSGDIVRGVTTHATDVGIVAGTVSVGELQLFPCRMDRLSVVTPGNHPLAGRTTIAFADLLGEQFVGLPPTSAIHLFLKNVVARIGGRLKMRIEVGSFESACRMIEAGVGIGIVPQSVAERHAKVLDIAMVQLSDSWAERRLQVCVRDYSALSPFAQTLVDRLTGEPGPRVTRHSAVR